MVRGIQTHEHAEMRWPISVTWLVQVRDVTWLVHMRDVTQTCGTMIRSRCLKRMSWFVACPLAKRARKHKEWYNSKLSAPSCCVRHMTQLYVWCDSSCVWHDSIVRMAWLNGMGDMPRASIMCVTWNNQMCVTWNNQMCVTWNNQMCDMIRVIRVTWLNHIMTGVTWLNHIYDMTEWYVWHIMGWLRLVGSIKLYVFFAKEPYKRDYILQKRPIILSSLLIVATSWSLLTSTRNVEQFRQDNLEIFCKRAL